MGLSNRELLLIMRARDEMSGTIRKNGAALTTLGNDAALATGKLLGVGTAFSATGGLLKSAGGAVLDFAQDSFDAFTKAEQTNAIIATQAQNLKLSIEDVNAIIQKVGSNENTPIDALRESLFEILSTVESDVPDAIKILETLAFGGVASGLPSSDFAGVLTASLNAFDLTATDSMRVMDAIFRAYEQGQGSLTNFAGAFATAVPSAQAFNQTMEDTFGAVSFVTKATGLSESEAGTSVARVFDLFKKASGETNVVENLKAIGVAVADSEGNFRPIIPIMRELSEALGDLSPAARDVALQEIFGANVRAFRFLNPAIGDFEAFEAVLKEVNTGLEESSGVLGAYDIVSETTATKIQGLKNSFQLLREEIGAALAPAIENLIGKITELIDWWNSLDEETRKVIIQITVFAAIIAVVFGTLVAFVGAIATAAAILGLLGVSFGFVVGVSAVVLAVFALLVLAGILLYQNWDTIKEKAQALWPLIVDAFNAAKDAFIIAKDAIIEGAQIVWDKLQEWWTWLSDTFGPGLSEIWDTLVEEFNNVKDEVFETIDVIVAKFQEWWDLIEPVVSIGIENIKTAVSGGLDWIKGQWEAWGPQILTIITTIWDQIVVIVTTVITIVSNIIQLVLNIIQGDWSAAWENVKAILSAAWDGIKATIRNAITVVKAILDGFKASIRAIFSAIVALLKRKGTEMMNGLRSSIVSAFARVISFVRGIKGKVTRVFSGASSWLYNAGKNILQGLLNGITDKISSIKSKLGELTGLIPSWKGPPERDKRLLLDAGQLIMSGLEEGLQMGWGNVENFLRSVPINDSLSLNATGVATQDSSFGLVAAIERMLAAQEGNNTGLTVEGDLILGSADDIPELDFWAKKASAGV